MVISAIVITYCGGAIRAGTRSIANPWTDFDPIYDDRYYAGRGADPLVDFRFEFDDPEQTIRLHEWRERSRGSIEGLLGGLRGVRWLDFGRGHGGLDQIMSEPARPTDALRFRRGFDRREGLGVRRSNPHSEELSAVRAEFDVMTAIEVLEHTLEPLAELRRIRKLIRPGGLLFLTTGNAAPFASDLLHWSYIIPEIHVSFFEPSTLEFALRAAGFRPAPIGLRGGFDEILKFKVLKNLRVHKRSRLTDMLPAIPLAAVADRRVRLSRHPVGWAV